MNMKKIVVLVIALVAVGESFGQRKQPYNPQPSRSRFWNSKIASFPALPGDIFLYSLKTDTGQYNLVITIKRFDTAASFQFSIPEKSYNGNVFIPPASLRSAVKYDSTFAEGETELINKSVLWLSKKAYTDLYFVKQTAIDIGGGVDTFYRGNIGTYKINYKGKQRIITFFNVQGKSGKTFAVLNDIRNPLMVQLDANSQMVLKEVR